MAIDVTQVVDFFWNGLTNNTLIDPINQYVEMVVRIKVDEDRYICNGWKYVVPPEEIAAGNYITQEIVTQVVQGIAAKLAASMTSGNVSNPVVMKLHKPGVQQLPDLTREQEYYNVNEVLPYKAISVVLRTVASLPDYVITPLENFTGTTGASAASAMNDVPVSTMTNISADLNTASADFE